MSGAVPSLRNVFSWRAQEQAELYLHSITSFHGVHNFILSWAHETACVWSHDCMCRVTWHCMCRVTPRLGIKYCKTGVNFTKSSFTDRCLKTFTIDSVCSAITENSQVNVSRLPWLWNFLVQKNTFKFVLLINLTVRRQVIQTALQDSVVESKKFSKR